MVVISPRRTDVVGCQAEGLRGGGKAGPHTLPPPLGLAERTAPQGDHHQIAPCD